MIYNQQLICFHQHCSQHPYYFQSCFLILHHQIYRLTCHQLRLQISRLRFHLRLICLHSLERFLRYHHLLNLLKYHHQNRHPDHSFLHFHLRLSLRLCPQYFLHHLLLQCLLLRNLLHRSYH